MSNPWATILAEKAVGYVGGKLLDEFFAKKMTNGKMHIGFRINEFGRQTRQDVRIPDDHRLRHLWTVGRTGSGKSTLLLNMIVQDMLGGQGLCLIDPKGDLVDEVLKYIPSERADDVVLIDPTDPENVVGFNVFEKTDGDNKQIIYEQFMAIFEKLLGERPGVQTRQLLVHTVLTLLEIEGATIADIRELILNEEYRAEVLREITDPELLDFWHREYNPLSDAQKGSRAGTITNKLTDWTAPKSARYVVYQPESTFNLRHIMDNRQILLVKIPQGVLGENGSAFLGALLVTKIQVTIMRRYGLPEHQRPPFYLYVDEFQNFVTTSFAKILSEARSYGLGLVVANQYERQLSSELQEALRHNVAGYIECISNSEAKRFSANYNVFEGENPVQIKLSPLPPPKADA